MRGTFRSQVSIALRSFNRNVRWVADAFLPDGHKCGEFISKVLCQDIYDVISYDIGRNIHTVKISPLGTLFLMAAVLTACLPGWVEFGAK